jgi:hypothetical protein
MSPMRSICWIGRNGVNRMHAENCDAITQLNSLAKRFETPSILRKAPAIILPRTFRNLSSCESKRSSVSRDIWLNDFSSAI